MTTTIVSLGTTSSAIPTLDGFDTLYVLGALERSSGTSVTNNDNNIFISGIVAATGGQGFSMSGNSNVVRLSETGIIAQSNTSNSGTAVFANSTIDLMIDNAGEISGGFGVYNSAVATGTVLINSGRISSYFETSSGADGAGFTNFGDEAQAINTGSISGREMGVLAGNGDLDITNHGDISGQVAVRIFEVAEMDLFNSGTITGTEGFAVLDDSTDGATIRNYGEIYGSVEATDITAKNTLINGGTIFGNVKLGGGNDTYNAQDDGTTKGRISGEDGNDTLRGGSRDDELVGGNGNDTINGRAGDDLVTGGNGKDDVRGGRGDDDVKGGGSADVLRGGAGDDIVAGGAGNDEIRGGHDNDTLTGNAGADTFVFIRRDGDDVITDFENGTDLIDLSVFGFANFAALNATGAVFAAGGGDTIISLDTIGGEGQIYIEGIILSELGNADFIF